MEKEQIIKALECCTRGRKSKDDLPCFECPYNECNLVGGTGERQISGTCQGWLMKDALSLVREQENRIEELTLEKAGFEAGAKAVAKFIIADTVRKMQKAIEERCIKAGIYPAFVKSVVEAVAKELSEDVTPPAKLLSLESVSRAIKDYCCDLIDAGKDMVEVTEFNADLQKILEYYIGEKSNGTT